VVAVTATPVIRGDNNLDVWTFDLLYRVAPGLAWCDIERSRYSQDPIYGPAPAVAAGVNALRVTRDMGIRRMPAGKIARRSPRGSRMPPRDGNRGGEDRSYPFGPSVLYRGRCRQSWIRS
jgi:hypothetical protein